MLISLSVIKPLALKAIISTLLFVQKKQTLHFPMLMHLAFVTTHVMTDALVTLRDTFNVQLIMVELT